MPDLTDKIMANLDERLAHKDEYIEPDFIILCDGGSLDNQNTKIGYGSYLIEMPARGFRSAIKKHEYGAGVSNNEAEYLIAIDALGMLENVISTEGGKCEDYVVEIKTDSQLVIGHMSKNWKLKAHNLAAVYTGLKDKIALFKHVNFVKVPDTYSKEILGH